MTLESRRRSARFARMLSPFLRTGTPQLLWTVARPIVHVAKVVQQTPRGSSWL